MPAPFDPELLLGIPEIDKQHQEFLTRVDGLVQAIRAGSSRDELVHTLAFLRGYVALHLASEEALMERVGYSGLASHQQEHLVLIREMGAIEGEFRRNGPSPSLVLRVNSQISGWLREHIQRADRDLATFVKSLPA